MEVALLAIIAYLLTKPSSRPDQKPERPFTEKVRPATCGNEGAIMRGQVALVNEIIGFAVVM